MPGDSTKIRLWETGDVYVFDPTVTYVSATHDPADVTAALHAAWLACGLMLGDPGVDIPREIDKKDINAWQQKRVRTKYKNGKMDLKFTLLEDNTVTQGLINPLGVPKPVKRRLLCAFVGDDGFVERRWTKLPADIWVTNDNHPEDQDGRPCEASLYPDTASLIWARVTGVPS
jgi:hypothetical protein